MFKKSWFSIISLSLILLVFAAGCSAAPVSQALSGGPSSALASSNSQAGQVAGSFPQGITVVGTGRSSGTPDVANVSLGVQTQNASVQQAVKSNQDIMNAILAQLKALGIADADIRTSNYSIYTQGTIVKPVEPGGNSSGQDQMVYAVNNQVDVKVRDISKLSDVLDKAVTAGANNVYGINFSVSDTSKLEADARAAAVADAKARAESLAQLEGVSLGSVISVSESVSGPGPVYYAPAAQGLGGGGTPVQPGQLDVTYSVQVTYAIK